MRNKLFTIKRRVVFKLHPFFVFLLFLPHLSQAQFYFTPKLEQAKTLLLQLKFDAGQQLLHESMAADPNNGIAIYIENYADVLPLLISQDRNLYNQRRTNESRRMSQLQNLSTASPYYLFTQAEIKLQWAAVKLLFHEEFAAAWQIRQAYKLLEENNKRFPDFLPQQKTIGAINILIGTMPEKYRWIMDLLGLKGSIQKGMQQMQQVEQVPSPYSLETKLLRQVINLYVLNREKEAMQQFSLLKQEEKDNLLLHLLYAISLYKNNQGEALAALLANPPARASYYAVPYLWLLQGDAMLYAGKYDLAASYYKNFLAQHKGENFVKFAYYRLFLSAWLNHHQPEANRYKALAIKQGNAATEMDRYALSFVSAKSLPHPLLMKARLLADGGYQTEALHVLAQVSPGQLPFKADQADYYYRKARILHQQQKYDVAIPLYLKTIELTGTQASYLAPNASLQLGYIYQEKNQVQLATKYFQQAISYKNHEYKSSIDSKAKAALAALK